MRAPDEERSLGRPYSQDLRERVVDAAGATSRQQAAARFGVGVATAIRWMAALTTTGTVVARPPIGAGPRRRSWSSNFRAGRVNSAARRAVSAHGCGPCRYIGSPYDEEARYASKGATGWSGYKVGLTETCYDGTPNLITHFETTTTAVSDDTAT